VTSGEESALLVVLGDLCPRPVVLGVLSDFFAARHRTRLHLDYEAVGGPAERLRNETSDLDGADAGMARRLGHTARREEYMNNLVRSAVLYSMVMGSGLLQSSCAVAGASLDEPAAANGSEPELAANQAGAQVNGAPGGAIRLAGLSVPHVVTVTGAASTGFSTAFAPCPAGEVALGGGGQSAQVSSFGEGPAYLILNVPRLSGATPIGWDAWVSSAPGFTGRVIALAYAICAAVTP